VGKKGKGIRKKPELRSFGKAGRILGGKATNYLTCPEGELSLRREICRVKGSMFEKGDGLVLGARREGKKLSSIKLLGIQSRDAKGEGCPAGVGKMRPIMVRKKGGSYCQP